MTVRTRAATRPPAGAADRAQALTGHTGTARCGHCGDVTTANKDDPGYLSQLRDQEIAGLVTLAETDEGMLQHLEQIELEEEACHVREEGAQRTCEEEVGTQRHEAERRKTAEERRIYPRRLSRQRAEEHGGHPTGRESRAHTVVEDAPLARRSNRSGLDRT